MARVNVGVNPRYLTDQHLIAESVEITMITGQLRKHNFIIKSTISNEFSLKQGHMTFFKNKLLYLKCRLNSVNKELTIRGFNPSTHINLNEYPEHLCNNWSPTYTDSILIRNRIVERLRSPLKAKPDFHKYYKKPIQNNINEFINNLINSHLYHY